MVLERDTIQPDMKPLPETSLDCIDSATDVLPASAERGEKGIELKVDAAVTQIRKLMAER